MDFDEYEYLENTVENPEHTRLKDKVNGGDGKIEEKDRSRSSNHRNDDADDLGRLSKRLRSRKESHDHEKGRDSRHRSSSRDRMKDEQDRHASSREHRSRGKHEGDEKGRNSDRDRNRERNRDSGRDWDRERDQDKDKDRENDHRRSDNRRRREGEYESERNREEDLDLSRQNKSRTSRHQNEQGREGGKELDIVDEEYKDTRRVKEFRDRDHESRKYKEKKEEPAEPEADPERDQRTVFAYQISLKAGERDVYEFFSRAGKVRDVQLIMDRKSRRPKGVGYIEFYDSMSVPMAIALSGQPLLGHPVMVKPSEAEKNLVQPTAVASSGGAVAGSSSAGARKLYVGNLPITIREDQLRQVFEAFGTIELVQMPIDAGTGNCKGFAFIQFARLEDAKAAQNLNGQLDIAGRVIKVSAVTDQAGMQDAGANIADLDDDEGNAMSLNAHSRALLMQKLDRTGTASSIAGSSGAPVFGQTSFPVLPGLATAGPPFPAYAGPSVDTIGAPSEFLLLKNMFDPNSEGESDFDLDIKEDVQDECSKFGTLKHIYVEKNSAGFVYLRFENSQSAVAAQRALHGRWFAGKMITATFMLQHDYEAKFPNSS